MLPVLRSLTLRHKGGYVSQLLGREMEYRGHRGHLSFLH